MQYGFTGEIETEIGHRCVKPPPSVGRDCMPYYRYSIIVYLVRSPRCLVNTSAPKFQYDVTAQLSLVQTGISTIQPLTFYSMDSLDIKLPQWNESFECSGSDYFATRAWVRSAGWMVDYFTSAAYLVYCEK